jgi:hypothetical protein
MSKKLLYLFVPSKKWDNCGGCYAVIASSFGEASMMYPGDDKPNFYEKESDVPSKLYHGIWVLKETLDVNECSSRVVLINYNYA